MAAKTPKSKKTTVTKSSKAKISKDLARKEPKGPSLVKPTAPEKKPSKPPVKKKEVVKEPVREKPVARRDKPKIHSAAEVAAIITRSPAPQTVVPAQVVQEKSKFFSPSAPPAPKSDSEKISLSVVAEGLARLQHNNQRNQPVFKTR